ncbi:MAG: hypothetical protein JWM95_4912 [Gemmatimonadetes bacterium]|nr:hypothetical protein [Gemmatimonadota bacterium]
MLNDMSLAGFAPLVGQVFRARFGDALIDLTLVEASALVGDDDPRRQRTPFRLMFDTPSGPIAAQATYQLRHETMGEVAIFLVPISGGVAGIQYEAVFT